MKTSMSNYKRGRRKRGKAFDKLRKKDGGKDRIVKGLSITCFDHFYTFLKPARAQINIPLLSSCPLSLPFPYRE